MTNLPQFFLINSLLFVGMITLDTVDHLERFVAMLNSLFIMTAECFQSDTVGANLKLISFSFSLFRSQVSKILTLILRLLLSALKRTLVQRKKKLSSMDNQLVVGQH